MSGANPVERVLERLERVKRSGSGWAAQCPAHEDRHASLSIAEGDDGRVLLHCHAGCDLSQILESLDLEARDLFADGGGGGYTPSRTPATVQHPVGCTLEAYAAVKGLPVEFLRSLGLSEISYLGNPAVRIPYVDESGQETAIRFRIAAAGEDKFRWKKRSKLALYGLNLLARAREAEYVVLVEGESCAQTTWMHRFPALGLPGANNWNENRDAPQLDDVGTVYVLIEPDRGGETVLNWLRASRIRDRVRLVRLKGAKDVSELYLADPERFAERFEAALQSAIPWADHERVATELRMKRAWATAGPLAQEAHILDLFERDLERAGVVGEGRVAKLLYLALTSRFLGRPVSVAVKGPSAGGKSWTVERVTEFFPPDAYYGLTAMSERALAYSTEPLSHRFLILYEAGGIDSDFASYLVRSLLSEGRIRYETVEKTANGIEPRLIEREGPTGLIITTTAVSLHPENETRLLSLTVTDTAEQTRKVFLRLVDDPADPDLAAWRALQEWLAGAEHRVAIPYALALAELVPPVAVRLRRDLTAILNLIRVHALLHQASRERDATGRVVATIEDYAVVRALVHDLVSEGVEATVPETVRETVGAVVALNVEEGVSITALAKALELDKGAASRRWQAARSRGYLKNLEQRRSRPALLVVADPLPDDVEILPTPERVADRCSVAGVQEGYTPLPPLDDDAEIERLEAKHGDWLADAEGTA